jgi:hypothetical protein
MRQTEGLTTSLTDKEQYELVGTVAESVVGTAHTHSCHQTLITWLKRAFDFTPPTPLDH